MKVNVLTVGVVCTIQLPLGGLEVAAVVPTTKIASPTVKPCALLVVQVTVVVDAANAAPALADTGIAELV